jgi:predicted O-methyltransferase YrrM
MSNFLNYDDISDYVGKHISEIPDYLLKLEDETYRKVIKPRMMSGKAQGRFLSFLSHLIGPKNVLEIGSFTGYGTFCLAEGLNKTGKLDSIEVNDELKPIHERYLAKTDFKHQVQFHYGEAKSILSQLQETYDLIFLDADKKSYPEYLNILVPKLNPKGILLADNVLWYDRVIDEKIQDEETNSIRHFNSLIVSHPQLKSFILPVRDGLTIAQKKEA